MSASQALVEVTDLKKSFGTGGWRDRNNRIRAVDDVTFSVAPGETLGLVGESGSGKSTIGRCILRLTTPDSGRVAFDGVDILALGSSEMRKLRRRMQIVFQDAVGSLNPRMKVGAAIKEPIEVHRLAAKNEINSQMLALLAEVGLDPELSHRYPHELSGGQAQRAVIARALSVQPDFIVLDEPVAALDVSVQGQVLNLLASLQRARNLTYLLIAHDLSVVRHTCDRVAVMYLGRFVEVSNTSDLFTSPLHPYTAALLSAVPVPDPKKKRNRIVLEGEMPSVSDRPSGCPFYSRCPHPKKNDQCSNMAPELREHEPGRLAACHFAEEPLSI